MEKEYHLPSLLHTAVDAKNALARALPAQQRDAEAAMDAIVTRPKSADVRRRVAQLRDRLREVSADVTTTTLAQASERIDAIATPTPSPARRPPDARQ